MNRKVIPTLSYLSVATGSFLGVLFTKESWFFTILFHFLTLKEKLCVRLVTKKVRNSIDGMYSNILSNLASEFSPMMRYIINRNIDILKKVYRTSFVDFDPLRKTYVINKSYTGNMTFLLKDRYYHSEVLVKELFNRKMYDDIIILFRNQMNRKCDGNNWLQYYDWLPGWKNLEEHIEIILGNHLIMANVFYHAMWLLFTKHPNGRFYLSVLFKRYGRCVDFSINITRCGKKNLMHLICGGEFGSSTFKCLKKMYYYANTDFFKKNSSEYYHLLGKGDVASLNFFIKYFK
jgi:hypothetical protein